MQRISVGALIVTAGALGLWLAVVPEEEDSRGARVAALRDVRDAAQAGSSQGVEAATPGTKGNRGHQRELPGLSVGDARTTSPLTSEDPDSFATAGSAEASGGDARWSTDAGRPGSADPPRRSPDRWSSSESVAGTTDAEAAEASDSFSEFADLEAEAARAAERLELLDPIELERRVDLALSEQPTGNSEQARDDARRRILADAAIVEDLIRARYGSDSSSRAARNARGTGHTLLSTQSDAYRDSRLVGLADRLAY